MQLPCRVLFVLVNIFIFMWEVHSRGMPPLIDGVSIYPESDHFWQIGSALTQNVGQESDFKLASESTSVPSLELSSKNGQDVPGIPSTSPLGDSELQLSEGLNSTNHTRRSTPTPQPTICFEISSRTANEPPTTVCEPITVARKAPDGTSTVRYNTYVDLLHSSTPLVVLPPNPTVQHNPTKTFLSPLTPGYIYHPQHTHILPSQYNMPVLQLPQSIPPNYIIQGTPVKASVLSSFFPSGYVFQPNAVYRTYPLSQHMSPLQVTPIVPPYPPIQVTPVKTTILQSSLPPGYALQPAGDRNIFPPNYYYLPIPQPQSSSPSYSSGQVTPSTTTNPRPQWPPIHGYRPFVNSRVLPATDYMSPLQYSPVFAINPTSQFISTNAPSFQPPEPPGYAPQPDEDRNIFPPNYNFPIPQPQSSSPSCPSGQVTPSTTTNLRPQWPPIYGYRPFVNSRVLPAIDYMSPLQYSPVFFTNPTSQFIPSKIPSVQSPEPLSNGYQAYGNNNKFLANYHMLQNQFPPRRPLNSMSQFTPVDTKFLQNRLPGYGIQPFVNFNRNTSYNMPFPFLTLNRPYPVMYASPPSPPVSFRPYTPNSLTAYGKPSKLESNSQRPVLTPPPKNGFPITIKDQEETHKVPTPIEETEKSQDYPSSRAASFFNPMNYYPSQLPVGQSYGFNVLYNPSLIQPSYVERDKSRPNFQSYPSNAFQFTFGQNAKYNSATASAGFSPYAPPADLTCKVHNTEDRQAKQIPTGEPIAILQLFLKPNPTRYDKYRQNVPQDDTITTGNSDVRQTTQSSLAQYDQTITNMTSKNNISENKAGRGQTAIGGLMGNLKEGEMPSQGWKQFQEEQNYRDRLKWNEEQRAMQQYLEPEDVQRDIGANLQLLQTYEPVLWYQEQLASPQVVLATEKFYNEEQQIPGQRPYFEMKALEEQIRTPQQWWSGPQQWWATPQLWWESPPLNFRKQYYLQAVQSAPVNGSSDQYLNNQLLVNANKYALHVQKKLPEVKRIQPFEARRERINETMEKQLRLNTVKAKLLQQYQSRAAERNGNSKGMNSSSKVNVADLNANISSKLEDTEANTLDMKLSSLGYINSDDVETSQENSNKPTENKMKAVLDDSQHSSHKVRSMSRQEEMPANSRQMYGQNFATNGESHNVESKYVDSRARGEQMDPRLSYLEQSTPYGLEDRGNTRNGSSSYPVNVMSSASFSKPNTSWSLVNGSIEMENVNGTSQPEESKITYSRADRKINLRNSVIDSPENNTYEKNIKMAPDETSDNMFQSNQGTVSEHKSSKVGDQTPLNINSSEFPRINNNSMEKMISEDSSWLREIRTKVTALPNQEMAHAMTSVVPSGVNTEFFVQFNTQGNVTDYSGLTSTTKSGSNSDKVSEADNNKGDSSSREMKDIKFKYDGENVSDDSGGGKATSGDVVTTSGPRDSIVSQVGNSSDSLKTDFSDRRNKQANVNKSDTTVQTQNQQRDVSDSDKEITSDSIENSTANLPSEGETAAQDAKPGFSSKKHLSADSSSFRNVDMTSNGYNSSTNMSFTNKSDDMNSSDSLRTEVSQISDGITESGVLFKSEQVSPVSQGSSPSSGGSTASMQYQMTKLTSELPSNIAESVQGSASSSTTKSRTPTEVSARKSSNENSKPSDESFVTSSEEDVRRWEEAEEVSMPKLIHASEILQVGSSERGRSSEVDSSTAEVYHSPNKDDYSKRLYNLIYSPEAQSQYPVMSPDQNKWSISSGSQLNSESGFPQTPRNEMRQGHPHQGNIGNSEIARSETFPVFPLAPPRGQSGHPSVMYPTGMRFMVYPTKVPSIQNQYYKSDPWQFTNTYSRPYAYHVPYMPDYLIRFNPHYYPHNTLQNNPGTIRTPRGESRRQGQKNVDGHAVKGNLPVVVVLEE